MLYFFIKEEKLSIITSIVKSFANASIIEIILFGGKLLIGDAENGNIDIYVNINVNWLNPFKEQKLVIICEKGMLVFDDTLKENWDNSESDLQQQELDMFDCKRGTIIIQEMTPVYRSKKIKK